MYLLCILIISTQSIGLKYSCLIKKSLYHSKAISIPLRIAEINKNLLIENQYQTHKSCTLMHKKMVTSLSWFLYKNLLIKLIIEWVNYGTILMLLLSILKLRQLRTFHQYKKDLLKYHLQRQQLIYQLK